MSIAGHPAMSGVGTGLVEEHILFCGGKCFSCFSAAELCAGAAG